MKKVFITALFLNILGANAQDLQKSLKGDDKYESLAYSYAIDSYIKDFEKGNKSKELFQKLGDSYYLNGNLKDANTWYRELFDLNEKVDPEYYYKYSQTLKATNDLIKAESYLSKFAQEVPNDSRAIAYKNHKTSYKTEIEKKSKRYTIKPVSVNTVDSDYGVSYYGENVVFSSCKPNSVLAVSKTGWTNQSLSNLYLAKADDDNLVFIKSLPSNVNSKYHEDTPVFTKDLKTVYFTRNNYSNGKVGKDDKGLVRLKIYKADIDKNGKWINIKELPFSSDQYSVAHPALSTDEKTLFFVSDMPGTIGNSDIFKVSISGNDTYGTPTNLGKKVNTEGKETFPYVSSKNELYFSSDGHLGLGGLDVFAVKLKDEEVASKAINVGTPVNSEMDDFAFVIDEKRNGYFSSNRVEGKGLDDIYSFIENKPLVFECKQDLSGAVIDVATGATLNNAQLQLVDVSTNQVVENLKTDAIGTYKFKLDCEKSYALKAAKEGYNSNELNVSKTEGSDEPITLKVPLEKLKPIVKDEPVAVVKVGGEEKEVKIGTDLAKTFEIKMIYFDLGKFNIRPDAALELAKIVNVLKELPSMKIDIRTHTDCRSSKKSNSVLSSNRAKSIRAWMVKKGIAANRLTFKGYGESQPVNGCYCEGKVKSDCSEEQHQANRRSEFIILKM